MSILRVLVLGADNFLGRRVFDSLERSGWAGPIAVDSAASLSPETVRNLYGIVNAAGGSAGTIRKLARAAADAAIVAGPKVRLVHVSSMTVYGTMDNRVSETAERPPDLDSYASAQAEAESLLRPHAEAVILRPGCEYGPGCPAWSERIAALLRARRLGDLGAAGDGWCNLIYVDDLVAAILESLRRPGLAGEVFNLAMPSPPTWNEYLIRFSIALRAVPVRRIPRRRLALETRVFAPPLKALDMVARRFDPTFESKTPALTSSLLRLCGQRILLDSSKAEKMLGVRWTPLAEGLARAAAALRREPASA